MELTIIREDMTITFTMPDDTQCQYSLVCTSTPVTMMQEPRHGWSQTGWLAVCQECHDFYCHTQAE